MTAKRFVEAYAGKNIKKLIGIKDIETNRVCITIEENILLLNELHEENEALKSSNLEYEDALGILEEENERLENKIDVLEDDNETYHKSLEKLNLYTNRFIPTKCTNEFKDCKTNRYYWLDHEGNFEGCLELLNLLDCEKELLESENRHLKGRLMLYEKSDLDYVEMEIDKELYSKLKEKYEFFDNISLSFDEYLNYLIQVGLDND